MPPVYSSGIPLKNTLSSILDEGKDHSVFPGACTAVSFPSGKGREKVTACSGRTSILSEHEDLGRETFFDLASLTKPLATTLAILSLVKKNIVSVNDKLESLLEREVGREKREITLKHLLNHCSGLPAYETFYKEDVGRKTEERRKNIIDRILSSPLSCRTGEKAEYSDLGFILLGEVVELKTGMTLDAYSREKIYLPLGLEKRLFFNPLGKREKLHPECYAATENCTWRKRILRGEVHDENTFLIGGVSGQAGLFGDVEAVLALAECILEMWKGRRTHGGLDNSDLQYFLKPPGIVRESSWALGFDTPSAVKSSAGSHMSRTSVGHLGFTGTSFWIDPEREAIIVLLTNRIHPTRNNTRIKKFRPYFHDKVMGLLS